MKILGIETSCDETAVAVVDDMAEGADRLKANIVLSQIEDHRKFGGVVPEIAARAHLRHLPGLLDDALAEAGITLDDIDAVAATGGPGLIGGVMVGVTMAKGLALAADKPFIAVNHLEAHALTARLTDDAAFPYLLLLVSGGHCQLVLVEALGRYTLYGTTHDDAVGEAFDKTAKLLGLGYPGGPALERMAEKGAPGRFALPAPMVGRPDLDFSFSGLKTAVRTQVQKLGDAITDQDRADLAHAFQTAAVTSLADRTKRALDRALREAPDLTALVVAGGVAANKTVRDGLSAIAEKQGVAFLAPPMALCTDNAAMVAWAGLEKARRGDRDALDFKPRPRWPLDSLTQRHPNKGQGEN
ncbi:MAG: tRNA (adenosine(37)-N6)-threonylcarbamoyltransferase complex transferase subunit TsaD [Alphaproteobacteria bacterium]|nr:tRNA (adenosine(37)-N6)-threonylcarbamoyltransferase complex transferase subunit TsaD [Alphaproteobacteria bacterium]